MDKSEFKKFLFDKVMVGCRNCWDCEIIDKTSPPRGWAGKYDNPEKVVYVFVSLNPASPKREEVVHFGAPLLGRRDFNIDEDLDWVINRVANRYLMEPNNEGRSGKRNFHEYLGNTIKEILKATVDLSPDEINDNFLEYVWCTDLFKCSFKKKLNGEEVTFNKAKEELAAFYKNEYPFACCLKHLFIELEYFQPKAIIALGGETYKELTLPDSKLPSDYKKLGYKKWGDKNKVYKFPHPSYARYRGKYERSFDDSMDNFLESFFNGVQKGRKIKVNNG